MSKPASYSEVDAMRDVDAALGQLDPDAQLRVIEWASSKHKLSPRAELDGAQAPRSGETAQARDIKSFIGQKRPVGHYERIACLVYHLEKFQGKAEVDTKDIIQANSDARQSKMSNPSVFIKHAIHTYGYLTSLGKRKFALSLRGEAVVDGLPDRARVEEAQTHNPFGKRAKRSSRSKK